MKRLVQICASHNDLFGLDEEGVVHQYDFNAKTWVKLAQAGGEAEGGRGVSPPPTGESARLR